MASSECTDQVVGAILSGWRYDISGITPEMRHDYEQHLIECSHCRHRQQFHRTIDVSLIVISTISILAFMVAVAILHRYGPLSQLAVAHVHLRSVEIALTIKETAIAGLLFSTLAWVMVAIATPAPGILNGMIQERLPEDLRERYKRA